MDKAWPRFLIVSLLLAAPLRADLAGAKAAYARGVELEKSKHYVAAMNEYKAALDEEPAYAFAHRQIGNCLYYLGNKQGAVSEYESYLAARPEDAQVKAFSDRLKSELPSPAAGPATLESPRPSRPVQAPPMLQDSFYVGLSAAEAATSSDDMQQLLPGVVIKDSGSLLASLKAGFLSESGFWLEGAYTYGPWRQYPILYSSSGFQWKETYTFTESTFSLEPGFRFPVGRKVALGGGIAFGLSNQYVSHVSTLGQSEWASGSNYSYSPEIKCSLAFSHIGVDIDLGYHISKSGTMKSDSGVPVLYYSNLATLTKSPWIVDNSGVFLRVGAVYYFSKPMALATASKHEP